MTLFILILPSRRSRQAVLFALTRLGRRRRGFITLFVLQSNLALWRVGWGLTFLQTWCVILVFVALNRLFRLSYTLGRSLTLCYHERFPFCTVLGRFGTQAVYNLSNVCLLNSINLALQLKQSLLLFGHQNNHRFNVLNTLTHGVLLMVFEKELLKNFRFNRWVVVR